MVAFTSVTEDHPSGAEPACVISLFGRSSDGIHGSFSHSSIAAGLYSQPITQLVHRMPRAGPVQCRMFILKIYLERLRYELQAKQLSESDPGCDPLGSVAEMQDYLPRFTDHRLAEYGNQRSLTVELRNEFDFV